MKKLLIGLFAFFMVMGMVSCAKDGAKGDAKEAVKVDPQEVLDKAKAEGANWDEAQWKDAIRDMFKGLTPLFDFMRDMQDQMAEAEKMEDEAQKLAAAAKIMADVQAKQQEFEPLSKIMEEFEGLGEKFPALQKVLDDKAFQEELKKEFNLPEDM